MVIESIPLALELTTSALNNSPHAYEDYVRDRVAAFAEKDQPSEAVMELIIILGIMSGQTIVQWAEDTGRLPGEIMQAIGIAYAQMD